MKKNIPILILLTALVAVRARKSQQQENSTNIRTDNDKGVKLFGGSTPSEGNVYIINSAKNLGPVCDDSWEDKDAIVVCRQLGYVYGSATVSSEFGSVPDDFAMDDVNCNGDEDRIQDCPFNLLDNCGGGEGAGVRCISSNVLECHTRNSTWAQGFYSGLQQLFGSSGGFYEQSWEVCGAKCISNDKCQLWEFDTQTGWCWNQAQTGNPKTTVGENITGQKGCTVTTDIQMIDGEAKCPGGSTICGDFCIPPGQSAWNDYDIYCCTSTNTSHPMRMYQVCHGKCQGRRTICGDSCIPPDQQVWNDQHVYCCTGNNSSQVIRMDQVCHGTSCFVDGIGWRRTICGDSCIPPNQRAENNHDVYCCTINNTSHVTRMDHKCSQSFM